MNEIRISIIEDRFPEYIEQFMKDLYGNSNKVPEWVQEALKKFNIEFKF